jgi:virulence factor Mce-like protein
MKRTPLIAIAAALALAAIVVISQSGNDDGYTVRAEFKDLEGIRKNFWVRVDGTRVGTVTDVQVTRRDTALVTMKIDSDAVPFGNGARAMVRPANLLGEKYIQLWRGDLQRPMASGSTIPTSRTNVAVELDDVLNMLEPGVRMRMRILINEIGIALAGRGADFNKLLTQLPRTIGSARQVVGQLAAENQQLARLVDKADEVAGPLARKREDIGKLVDSTRTVLKITANKRVDLARTVRGAPAALNGIATTLGQLDRTAKELEPAVPLLRKAAPPLASTLRSLPEFADSLEKPLETATRVAPNLAKLGTQGDVGVRRLRPTVAALSDFSTRIKPLVYTLGRAGGVDGVMGILNNWSKAASYKDGISHYFDFHASISNKLLDSAVQRLTLPETPAATKKQATPTSTAKPKLPAIDIPGLLPRPKPDPNEPAVKPALPAVTATVEKTKDTVGALLDYLLKP